MIQRFIFRLLMAPFALLYGIGVAGRNMLYNIGFLKATSFSIPIISVGNLTVGGAGKTPHVEYLTSWLSQYIDVAVLSRGYKRSTRGFLEVGVHHRVEEVGDEALQYKRKFPMLGVFVSESRVLGVPKIIARQPQTQTILLDDGFQHRAIKPGLNILLTEFDHPFQQDYLLPMGRLREWRSGAQRADIIIVTKCPDHLSEQQKKEMFQALEPGRQQVFFTYYRYAPLRHIFYPAMTVNLHSEMDVLVISAIAKTEYLLKYLEHKVSHVKSIEYEDHHQFTNYEVAQLKKQFDIMESQKKIIVTTEKDAVRLERHARFIQEEKLPIFVLPVFVAFHGEEELFKRTVQNHLLEFKV